MNISSFVDHVERVNIFLFMGHVEQLSSIVTPIVTKTVYM